MRRFFTRAGYAVALTGLMTLSLAAAGGVNAGRDHDNNPKCDGYDYSYKVESPGSGTYTVNRDGLIATFTVGTHPDVESPNENNAVTSFDANLSSGIVIVKGGNGAIIYGFDAGTPMHSPPVASGKWPTISHVQLCWDAPEEPVPPGRIEVNKQVVGENAPADAQFRIALKGPGSEGGTQYQTLAAGETAVFDDLDPGVYLVTEEDVPDGFDVETDLPIEVEVDAGQRYQVQIQNRFRHQCSHEGSVAVTKVVIGPDAPADAEFTISLTGPGSEGDTWYETVKAGETAVFDGLEPGWYTVSETDLPDGFVPNDLPHQIEVKAGHTATVDVINEYRPPQPTQPGTVEVTKVVSGEDAPTDAEFTLCLTGPGSEGPQECATVLADETAMFDGLEPGEYVLTETHMPIGFTLFTDLPIDITVGEGQTVGKTVVNEYTPPSSPPSPELGTVEVTKQVTGTDAPDVEFQICLTDQGSAEPLRCETVKAGETAVFDELEEGTYSVSETDLPDDFVIVSSLPMTVEVIGGQTTTATVTNEYVEQESLPPTVEDDADEVVDEVVDEVADEGVETEADEVDDASDAPEIAALPETGSGTVLALVATVLMLTGGALLLLGRRPQREIS